MENWWVELRVKEKIQRGIYQGDAVSLLLFVIAMVPLNYILRKCTAGCKLRKLQKMYMDDIKLFTQKKKKN